MTFSTLLFEVNEQICTITINRPDKLNALNKAVFDDLEKAFNEIEKTEDIRSVIITGSGGKAFVAGADIAEFSSYTVEQARTLSARGQEIFFKIEKCSKPVVAAVNGFALGGGCELAMACHFRICSENAKFGQPEVNLGLIPGYGGTQRLTQLVGKGKSMELHMTGQMMDASDAFRTGLVNYVTTAEALLAKAREILITINGKAPFAISKVIETINAAMNDEGEGGFTKEVNAFAECFGTADMKEGTTAFLEKRKPVFSGK